jgi:hypothetical protein
MSAPPSNPPGHSADVRIDLHVNDHVLPVAQLGPEFLVLRTPADHPPCDAEIALSIDGRESRWPVHLHSGIRRGCRKTPISRRGDGSGATATEIWPPR